MFQMGQIKTILLACKVNRPENNRLFRIFRSDGRVIIHYRNIRAELAEKVFQKCVAELKKINRDVVDQFKCSKDNFAEVLCFLGLGTNLAKSNALTWERLPGNQFVLRYRYLEMALTAREGETIEAHIARVAQIQPPVKFNLKTLRRRIFRRAARVAEPMLHERLSVDLCENIHLHFQNIRLEFDKKEFFHLWDILSGIDWNRLPAGEILHDESLPEATEWDDRLQLEEQVEGHYHLHYRNLRIEFVDFEELGIELKFDRLYSVDADFNNKYSKPQGWKLAGIRSDTIANLKAIVYNSNGFELRDVKESPIYQALSANNPAIYNQYKEEVLKTDPACRYDWNVFQALKNSIERDGYNENHLIIIKGSEKKIMDGQHRASILAWLYGDQHKVKVAHYK